MTLQKDTSNENMTFSWINTDKFKTGMLTFGISMPLDEKDYLHSLILAGVMRRGTENMPSMALINRRLDDLYAATVDIQSVIHAQTLCFTVSAEFLNGRFSIDGTDIVGGVIDVVSDILTRPLLDGECFPESCVASEKVQVKDSLAAEKNNTRLYAATRLKELMSRGNNPHFPRLEFLLSEVDRVSPADVFGFYRKLSSLPINVFYVGAENADGIKAKLDRAFPCSGNKRASNIGSVCAERACKYECVLEDMPVNQGKLCMGWRTGAIIGSHESAVATVLNELFGASPASKLFLNVRERLSLCYYCSSSYSLLSGNLNVSCGIDPANRERAHSEILAQLEKIKNGNISEAEFRAAKKSLEYNYVQIYDSPYALQSFYSVRDTFGIDQSIEECAAAIAAVTPEDVVALANKLEYDTCFFLNGTNTDTAQEDDDE